MVLSKRMEFYDLCFRMIISAEVSGMKQEWRSEQLGSY
jgi:hypothetical protein